MSNLHRVIFYPVGNGDTSQVIVANGRRLLFDFLHRDQTEDEDVPEIDLKDRLRAELEEARQDFIDVVAFTHGDEDHIKGSTDFFVLEHDKSRQGKERFKATEMWFPAAMLLAEEEGDKERPEYLLHLEGRHRLLEGKGVLVFSRPERLIDWLKGELKKKGLPEDAREHLFVDAGEMVPGFTLEKDQLEVFCHSPFIKHCETGDIIRNEASLVFNVRMEIGGQTYDYLEVGDSTWDVLEDIVATTEYHGNMDRLDWDIFNIPHHCSYLALSDEKGEKETDPKPQIKKLLERGKKNSYVVSSSKPIPDTKEAYNDLQPPHIQARKAYERYVKNVGGRKFLVTGEEPRAKSPEPIVFELTGQGISWTGVASMGAPAIIRSTPPRAGQ